MVDSISKLEVIKQKKIYANTYTLFFSLFRLMTSFILLHTLS